MIFDSPFFPMEGLTKIDTGEGETKLASILQFWVLGFWVWGGDMTKHVSIWGREAYLGLYVVECPMLQKYW
jgi:hypothetical protein